MLYRFTLTLNIDENESTHANIERLKNSIKNEAGWVGSNPNITVEDEHCIQTNKKRLVAPIITTLDTTTMAEDKTPYLSAARLLMENLKQLQETTAHSDYHSAMIMAINALIEKNGVALKDKESALEGEETHE